MIHDFAGAIGGTIVDRDHFVVVIIEFQQRRESRPDVFFLVTSRNDDADPRIAVGVAGLRFHSGREMSATLGMPRAASTNAKTIPAPRMPPAIQWNRWLMTTYLSKASDPLLDSYRGSESHAVKQYGRRDGHGDDRQNERGLKRASIGDVSHKGRRRNIAQKMEDENINRNRGRTDVGSYRVNQRGVQRRSI